LSPIPDPEREARGAAYRRARQLMAFGRLLKDAGDVHAFTLVTDAGEMSDPPTLRLQDRPGGPWRTFGARG
jgi:hypothetical protein